MQPWELALAVGAFLFGLLVQASSETAGDGALFDQFAEGDGYLSVGVGALEADAFVFELDGDHFCSPGWWCLSTVVWHRGASGECYML